MSTDHKGNIQNQIIEEEHEGLLNAKRVSLVSAATVFAVVNTGASAGNTTVEQGTSPWVSSILGNVTVEQGGASPWDVAVLGNVTLSDSKGFIGLVSVSGLSFNAQGAIKVEGDSSGTAVFVQPGGGSVFDVAVIGNVTLEDPGTFIGLVTTYHAPISLHTTIQKVISADGVTAISAAVADNFFTVKDLFVSSLGSGEVRFEEATTVMVPYASLATKSGYALHFGEDGIRAGTVNTAFNARLNGAATVSIMANVRFTAT